LHWNHFAKFVGALYRSPPYLTVAREDEMLIAERAWYQSYRELANLDGNSPSIHQNNHS